MVTRALLLPSLVAPLLLGACGPAPDVGDVQEAGGMIADPRGVFITGARPATPLQTGLFLLQLDSSAAERIAGGDGTLAIQPQLLADADSLYFAASTVPPGGVGIYRLGRKEGSTPQRLADARSTPTAMALDGSFVYWSVQSGLVTGDILKVPLVGGAVTTVQGGVPLPHGLAVDANNAYFTDDNSPRMGTFKKGEVRKVPLSGGDSTVLLDMLTEPREVAVNATSVVVVDAGAPQSGCSSTDGAVYSIPLDGSKPFQLDYGLQGAGGLVVQEGNAWYRTGYACGRPPENAGVWRAPVSGVNHSTPIAMGLVGPKGLAVDVQYIYWTIIGTGTTQHAVLRRAAR